PDIVFSLQSLDASASSANSAEPALDSRKWPLQERPQLDAHCWRTIGEKLRRPLQAQSTKRRVNEPVQLSGTSRYCGTLASFQPRFFKWFVLTPAGAILPQVGNNYFQ